MLVDMALERAEAVLSNAASTTAWKARNGEQLVCASESAGWTAQPLSSVGGEQ